MTKFCPLMREEKHTPIAPRHPGDFPGVQVESEQTECMEESCGIWNDVLGQCGLINLMSVKTAEIQPDDDFTSDSWREPDDKEGY